MEIQTFSFGEMRLKMSSAKWRPAGLGLYVLILKLIYLLFVSEMSHRTIGLKYIFVRLRIRRGSFGNFLYTLRPRQNGHRFADDIIKCIFVNQSI